MTLKTTANLQEFLYSYACGDSIKKALAKIGGSSEQTVSNWVAASRKSGPDDWLVHWPPDRNGKQMKFHDAYADARAWSMKLRQSELRADLELELSLIRETGPKHRPPPYTPRAHDDPPEGIGSDPLPRPPADIRDHPRAYFVEPLRPQRQAYHRGAPLTRSGYGPGTPPAGGFSVARHEVSRAEARAGTPRIVGYGVRRD